MGKNTKAAKQHKPIESLPGISTLAAIKTLSNRVVDCGEWLFQIVPVSGRDIMFHSARFMISLGAESLLDDDAKVQLAEKMRRMSTDVKAKVAAASVEQNEAIACTGVVAVQARGCDWVPAQLVMHHSEVDHSAAPIKIHLPVVCSAESVRKISDAIKALASDDGRAAICAASFCKQP